MRRLTASLFAFAALTSAGAAHAFAGPDSVAVLANADVPESVALAKKYMAARSIPAKYLCALSMPVKDDITFEDYETKVDGPFETCLKAAGIDARIEAVVVARGVPLRVGVTTPSGVQNAALTAVLAAWRSADGTGAIAGQPPGTIVDCGSPCLGAKWTNPYRNAAGPIVGGMTMAVNGVTWKPLIVTMLHGRSYDDAALLITSAIDAEKAGGATGPFVFMDGADSARGVLDSEYPSVIAQLKTAGFTDTQEVPFDTAWKGPPKMASFFTGTAGLGTTIESNTFAPGALVDNLTSYGAAPQNFAASGESQVSIARWVKVGVAGVHGTVDEPLNNCFPSRRLIVDYVTGAPLGEAYFRRLPFIYWRNLVLGDPMLAPYAKRPEVTISGFSASVASVAQKVTVHAVDKAGSGIETVRLYADGDLVGEAQGDTLEVCLPIKARKVELLAVAQNKVGAAALAKFPQKGWTTAAITGDKDSSTCATDPPPDAGTTPDPQTPPSCDGGCSCREAPSGNGASAIGLGLIAGIAILSRRRRT
ncbi:hypothetical protein BH09MYX1_BH09MYX1_40910 [soil metagenome]